MFVAKGGLLLLAIWSVVKPRFILVYLSKPFTEVAEVSVVVSLLAVSVVSSVSEITSVDLQRSSLTRAPFGGISLVNSSSPVW